MKGGLGTVRAVRKPVPPLDGRRRTRYERLKRPLPFPGKARRAQQLRETREHHELHVDEAAPSDVSTEVERRVGRWHDDRDGSEAVIRLVLGQQAFEALLGLLDALNVQRGFRHELWLPRPSRTAQQVYNLHRGCGRTGWHCIAAYEQRFW